MELERSRGKIKRRTKNKIWCTLICRLQTASEDLYGRKCKWQRLHKDQCSIWFHCVYLLQPHCLPLSHFYRSRWSAYVLYISVERQVTVNVQSTRKALFSKYLFSIESHSGAPISIRFKCFEPGIHWWILVICLTVLSLFTSWIKLIHVGCSYCCRRMNKCLLLITEENSSWGATSNSHLDINYIPRHLHELITLYSVHNFRPLDSVIN